MIGGKLILAAALLAGASLGAAAQTVTPLKHSLPFDGIVYGFLLTDGSILYQGGGLIDWYRFVPDEFGNYVNGKYYPVASLPPDYIPYATSGGVLPDGRVLLIGGEYLEKTANVLTFALSNKMAIYDPRADAWTKVDPPAGWDFIGDSPWTILADGRVLLGQKLTKRAAVLNPSTLTWTEVSTDGKLDFNSEEGWTLLPDGTVLTVDVLDHPHAERFLPSANPTLTRWASAGETPMNLQGSDANSEKAIKFDGGRKTYYPPGEVGPAILRPDGSVFATGAVCGVKSDGPNGCQVVTTIGHTAIYHPGGAASGKGSWTAGPDFPDGEGAGDSYASLLPNGHVLVETNPAGTTDDAPSRFGRIANHEVHAAAIVGASRSKPTWHFYEFDGDRLVYEPTADFVGGQASTVLLPSGEVMLNGQAVYATFGSYRPAWEPTLAHWPSSVSPGGSYDISGRQFNGLSQANAYGDEFTVATNYPLVRITNTATGHVTYARTHHISSMGVATGSAIVSAKFDVPRQIEPGQSTLSVVANGIPSPPVYVTVESKVASEN